MNNIVSNKKNNFVIVIPYLNEKEKNTVIDKRLLKFNNVILYEKSTIIENLLNLMSFSKEHHNIMEKILDNSINNDIKINNYKLGKVTDFAFLYHIIANYDNLDDYIIYSKAHGIQQCYGWNNFLDEMNNLEDYRQFGKIYRRFIFLSIDDPITNEEVMHKYPGYESDDRDPNMYQNPSNKEALFIARINFRQYNKYCKSLLKKIFPNYQQKSNLKPVYCEGTFVVSKKLIQYHKIDTYKMILLEYINACKEIQQNQKQNSRYVTTKGVSVHDEFVKFYHFFFMETMERMSNSSFC
jgi:hypothetical protein